MLRGWENTFEQAVAIGKKGATDYQKIVAELQKGINGLTVDEDVLTDTAINTAFNKRPAIKDKTKSSGAGSGTGGSYKAHVNNTNPNYSPRPEGLFETKPRCSITFDDGYNTCYPRFGFLGASIQFPTISREGYKLVGWQSTTKGVEYPATGSYKIEGDDVLIAIWKLDTAKNYSRRGRVSKYTLGKFTNRDGWSGFNGRYANGGLNYTTGPAWLDGTRRNPEAVLNSIETKAFLQFADSLTKIKQGQVRNTNSNVVIDNISFNVESMSSVADGEKAFDAFVNKFKEIGNKQGISMLGTSNRN